MLDSMSLILLNVFFRSQIDSSSLILMNTTLFVQEINLTNLIEKLQKLEPKESIEINLHSEIVVLQQKINTVYFVNFSVLTKTDNQPFIPKGFEIVHDQFKLPIKSIPRPIKHETCPNLSISENSENIIIS